MAKFVAGELAVPDCTTTVAVPAFTSWAAGMVALIEVPLGVPFCVNVTGDPPGGVKRTTGDPPTRKLDPAMVMPVFAAPLRALLGVMLLMAGAAMDIVAGPDVPPSAVVTRNVPVPKAVSRLAGTLTIIDPVPGALTIVTLVGDPPGGVNATL